MGSSPAPNPNQQFATNAPDPNIPITSGGGSFGGFNQYTPAATGDWATGDLVASGVGAGPQMAPQGGDGREQLAMMLAAAAAQPQGAPPRRLRDPGGGGGRNAGYTTSSGSGAGNFSSAAGAGLY